MNAAMKNPTTILTPLDFSSGTDRVLETAILFARAFGARLILVHVVPPDPDFVGYEVGPQHVRVHLAQQFHKEHRAIQDYADQANASGLNATGLLLQGPTAETILAEIGRTEADLLILGSHGHGALYKAILGNVAEEILRKCPCPAVIIPVKKS